MLLSPLLCMHSGYIVASGLRRSNGVQGLRFIVQSGKDATFVEQRVEAFLHHVQVHLSLMVGLLQGMVWE